MVQWRRVKAWFAGWIKRLQQIDFETTLPLTQAKDLLVNVLTFGTVYADTFTAQ
jgi:hypothetical protein